jgi:hypothetical protein
MAKSAAPPLGDATRYEFDGFVDMAPKTAATYLKSQVYSLQVGDDAAPRAVRARPYYRRKLANGKVRVFFRTLGRQLG